jgi:DNA-binding PadR family transcriptional regulator
MDERITRAIIGALREQDRSGHELWKWLGPIHGTHEELTEASLYPILYRLEAEHMIRGEGREIQPTRRAYRMAARGLEMAARHGWPVVAHRREPDPILTPGIEKSMAHAQTTVAETTMPPPEVTGTDADAATTTRSDATGTDAVTGARPDFIGNDADADAKAQAIVRDYASKVDAGLRLSWPHRNSIRIEIGDHLQDCADELAARGLDPVAAATEAVARLGPPQILAEAATAAQFTWPRLLQGIRTGGYVAIVSGGLGLAAGASVLLLAPFIARTVATVGGAFGLHFYVPETVEWQDQQKVAAAWVGAFIAARRSTPRVAILSRRAEGDIRLAWAMAGALPLLLIVLVAPIALDSLTAVGLVGVPAAFIVGAWRSQGPGDDSASRRGVAQAALLLALFLLLPGFRAWVFDPATVPPANPPAAFSQTMSFYWHDNLQGTATWHVSVSGLDSAIWPDARIEFWPTVRQGATIAPDPRATKPSLSMSPGDGVDLATLPNPTPDWWVTLTATGADGQRRTLLADVHAGARSTGLDTLVGWVLARR